MERDMLTWALLFDTYGETLTEKQRLCCDLRYNQDLTLGEIGELEGISRQAVRENLMRAEAQMRDLEDKIGAVRRQLRAEDALETLYALADMLDARDETDIAARIRQAASQIKE